MRMCKGILRHLAGRLGLQKSPKIVCSFLVGLVAFAYLETADCQSTDAVISLQPSQEWSDYRYPGLT